MNNVVLMGRLTRDAELRYLQGGNNTAVARFTLAVDKNLSKDKKQEMESKNQPTSDFIQCQAFGKQAETIAKFTGKGLRILINGRIQTGSYEKDGQRIYTTDIIVNNAEFLDWKGDNNTQSNDDYTYENDFEATDYAKKDNRIPF